MQITIYGNSYAVKSEYLRAKSVNLLHEEDTKVFYIASDPKHVDPYNTILIVNLRLRTVFPLYLSVFNDIVHEYPIPIIQTFPAVYVIKSNATEFVISDYQSVAKIANHIENKYIAYAETSTALLIAPDLTSQFDMFSNQRLAMFDRTKQQRIILAEQEMAPSNRSRAEVLQQRVLRKVQGENKDVVQSTPSIPTKQQQPVSSKTPETPVRKPVTASSIPTPSAAKPQKPVPSKENLWRYCNITDDCTLISLTVDRILVVVNKRAGTVTKYSFDELIDNELLGFEEDTDLIRCINKAVNITHETSRVLLTDIRHSIRMFEQRKESPVTKTLLAYSNKTVYVALAPEQCTDTIKQHTINCHKQASLKYEDLKEKLKVFNHDLYIVLTNSAVSLIVVYDEGRKAYDVPLSRVYEAYPDCKDVGDIMRMFPIEYIINGSFFNVETPSGIRSVVPVVSTTFAISATAHYTVKGINYGYDAKARVIMKAPVQETP